MRTPARFRSRQLARIAARQEPMPKPPGVVAGCSAGEATGVDDALHAVPHHFLRIDADYFALLVWQWSIAIAGIDGGVCLYPFAVA
jgi:hypothetical protein